MLADTFRKRDFNEFPDTLRNATSGENTNLEKHFSGTGWNSNYSKGDGLNITYISVGWLLVSFFVEQVGKIKHAAVCSQSSFHYHRNYWQMDNISVRIKRTAKMTKRDSKIKKKNMVALS